MEALSKTDAWASDKGRWTSGGRHVTDSDRGTPGAGLSVDDSAGAARNASQAQSAIDGAGRRDLAVATIGEPVEWPARTVLALARLTQDEAETRQLLEDGLDLWAREFGLGDLNESEVENESDPLGLVAELESSATVLDAPLDPSELDRAFAEAEADVESMHDVNEVAGRVLMDEPIGFAELAGDELTPVEESIPYGEPRPQDRLGMDAAFVEAFPAGMNAAHDRVPDDRDRNEFNSLEASALGRKRRCRSRIGRLADSRRLVAIATLESWLQNLELRKSRRTQ